MGGFRIRGLFFRQVDHEPNQRPRSSSGARHRKHGPHADRMQPQLGAFSRTSLTPAPALEAFPIRALHPERGEDLTCPGESSGTLRGRGGLGSEHQRTGFVHDAYRPVRRQQRVLFLTARSCVGRRLCVVPRWLPANIPGRHPSGRVGFVWLAGWRWGDVICDEDKTGLCPSSGRVVCHTLSSCSQV